MTDFKGNTEQEISAMIGLSVVEIESAFASYSIEFSTWVRLASYYGKSMLKIPFYVHPAEVDLLLKYSMYIKNGESVQYSAKCALETIWVE